MVPATDFISGPLFEVLFDAFAAAAVGTPRIETTIGTNGVEVAPLAVQGDSPASGLFSFDKLSSLALLIEAIREDVAASSLNDANLRLSLVPLAHVVELPYVRRRGPCHRGRGRRPAPVPIRGHKLCRHPGVERDREHPPWL